MEKSDVLAIFSHLINFAIVIYFVTFLLNKNLLTTFDASISFFGLFVSLISNIYSATERFGGR